MINKLRAVYFRMLQPLFLLYFRLLFWYYRRYKIEIHPLELTMVLRTTKNIGVYVRSNKMAHRRYRMAWDFSKGQSYPRIAAFYGVTELKVRQCLWRVYWDWKTGGMRK